MPDEIDNATLAERIDRIRRHSETYDEVDTAIALSVIDTLSARLRRAEEDRDALRAALAEIRNGKKHEDNEHPQGEAWSMVYRFSNIARAALLPPAPGSR